MIRFDRPRSRSTSAAMVLALLLIATADTVRGQTTQPQLVPLSGRGGQGGSVVATQTPVPGPTTGVNTLNPNVPVQGPFTGSIAGVARRPFSGTLTLQEAVQRGLEYNLGVVNLSALLKQARGQQAVARSALMPNLMGEFSAIRQTINLGIRSASNFRGATSPPSSPPFNNIDLRARVSQSVFDKTARSNYQAAEAMARADELSVQDTRELVVLAVAGAYLQVAAGARVESARAQLETANALYQQNAERRRRRPHRSGRRRPQPGAGADPAAATDLPSE